MARRIKASVLHGVEDLRLEERILEPPAPSELQIAIKATSLCGSDLHYYHHYRNGDIHVQEPLSLGHESAGIVVEVGSEVKGFSIGDRVALEVGLPCGKCKRCAEGRYNICQSLRFRGSAKAVPHFQGTLQERVNHPAAWSYKLPSHITLELGALLEPLSVAIQACRRAQIARGGSILVIGAGTIGMLCATVSKAASGGKVVITDIEKERVHFACNHGFADRGLIVSPTRGQNIEERLKIAQSTAMSACDVLWEIGTSRNFDVVFECTGVEACTQAAIYEATRPGGKIVVVGMGNPIQTLPISAAALSEIDILGTFRYANTYEEAIQLIANKSARLPKLEGLITHRFRGLENTKRAFDLAGRTQDDAGNLVLKVLVEIEDDV